MQSLADVATEDPGAPVPKDKIDPDLVRIGRKRPSVGLITAAGIVAVCAYFLIRLGPDRRFGGAGETPTKVTVSDVLAGNVDLDSYVIVDGEPLFAHSIRATTTKGSLGLRASPVRGTGDRLWVVETGDAYGEPSLDGYTGRLRKLSDLPLGSAVREFTHDTPRPVFATTTAVKAGAAGNQVATVDGDTVTLADGDRVALDIVDPGAALVDAAFNEYQPDLPAWNKALAAAGITPASTTPETDGVRLEVDEPDAVKSVTAKLEKANLFAARVDPVTRHVETTWGEVKKAPPDARVDLVGLYVAREVPSDAYAVLTGDRPAEYWYVMPVTIALALIALLFLWALVRAVKRDLLVAKP
jgi:hypothetical protein